jgi:hypothetical protein
VEGRQQELRKRQQGEKQKEAHYCRRPGEIRGVREARSKLLIVPEEKKESEQAAPAGESSEIALTQQGSQPES